MCACSLLNFARSEMTDFGEIPIPDIGGEGGGAESPPLTVLSGSYGYVWDLYGRASDMGSAQVQIFKIQFYSQKNSPLQLATYLLEKIENKCVAVCCRVLQCVAGVAGCCRVLQGVAGCCMVLQVVAGCCSVLQGVAV